MSITHTQHKKWILQSTNEAALKQLHQELPMIPQALCKVLVNRGVTNYQEAQQYFNPDLQQLHNPFLMKDMDKAVNRLEQALNQQESIMIFGDYDVDGTTSVALVYSYLKRFTQNLHPYVPDRYKEGYGLSKVGIDKAKSLGCKLMITLDCGITAIEQVDYANSLGIDMIICDHHLPGDRLPLATAVLDPKRKQCIYPYKELSGCGVGFKLMQALTENRRLPLNPLFQHLDLLAISIAADIVPMTGENRILAFHGLRQINDKPSVGIQALMRASALPAGKVNISNVVFMLAPRINAAGRIKHALNAVNLLIEENLNDALSLAKDLDDNNQERKGADRSITEEAYDQILENNWTDQSSTVVYDANWHKGVIGIVASRLIERLYRPTVVLTKSGDKVAGSVRSVEGYNVYKALKACEDHLIQFGGHQYAAGLTMHESEIDNFRAAFEKVVAETIPDECKQPKVLIDAELDYADISPKFFAVIKRMEPFGPQNMRPVFVTQNIHDVGGTRVVGNEHLRIETRQDDVVGPVGIAFKQSNKLSKVQSGCSICYSIEENHWRDQVSLQLMVKDIQIEPEIVH